MLEIKKLTKKYDNYTAVDNLSLTVDNGEIMCFIGHNGAGKTTTLKSIAGILDFESGDILVDGLSIVKNPFECKKKIAYVPEEPDIYEHLTGKQYLHFILDVFQTEKKDRNKLINDFANRFEISVYLDSLIGSYSHGMRQKLNLIAAIIHSPKVLLLDEPFVGLDPKAAFTLKNIMRELCSDGASIFYSTHVLDVAQNISDKVAILKDGKLVISGTLDEVIGNNKSLENVFMKVANNE